MRTNGLLLILILLLLTGCNPSRFLADDQYMLTKNTVKVVDKKHTTEFDNLVYTVRPITNKKFLEVFPIKANRYVNHLPVTDSLGNVIKDTKWMQRMRNSGEEPVLLDTSMISYSLDQINIAMKNMGYFNAHIWPTVKYKGPTKLHPKRHKAEVVYNVEAGKAYYIRDIQYHIDIYEYKRIILKDTVNTLIQRGAKYNADLLLSERDRIVTNIRDNGYYYVSNDIISFKIDTLNSSKTLNKNNDRTLIVHIFINFSRITDPDIKARHAYKYYFRNVTIYPNYAVQTDSTYANHLQWINYHNRTDVKTNYRICKIDEAVIPRRAKDKPVKDIRPRILTDNILTKNGEIYSQTLISRSRKKLNDLRNFNYIDIGVVENLSKRDTINKIGYLDTYYRLSRNKLHSLAAEFDARSDKTSLSLTYTNRNLFRSAELFSVNVYGSLGFRIRTKSSEQNAGFILESQEVGAEASLDLRRLLFFRKVQKITAINYGTAIKLGVHYENSYLYERVISNFSLVYTLAHTYNLTHTITPISLSIVKISPKGEEFEEVMSRYSKEFRAKYQDNFLLSFKYGLTYTHPCKDIRNSLIIRFKAESSGMLLSAICNLAKTHMDEYGHHTIGSISFGNFELAEMDLRFTHIINKNNSVATRFNFGLGIPIWNSNTLPFEKSFYLGGSNSMRAWEYRSLGPGSYYAGKEEGIRTDIRTGDVKLEMNLEYRGTIYKFVKFGVFADAGNIWLSHKDAEMPNAEFNFRRFYKEIALGVGAGIRIDFGFFLIRLDLAVPIYDPSSAPGDKWISYKYDPDLGEKALNKSLNFIFGIGHAF